MKKIILIFGLLFSSVNSESFAQDISQQISLRDREANSYYVRISYGFWAKGGGRHLCELWTKVYVNGHKVSETYGDNNFLKEVYKFYEEKTIKIMYIGKAQREIDYVFYTTCGGDSEGIDRTDRMDLCKEMNYYVRGDNHATSIDYSLKAYAIPLHTLASEKIKGTIPNAYIPIGTKVKLLAKKGFPSELYNYQYSKTRTWDNSIRDYVYQWENLPQSTKSDILSVSAEDIFGSEAQRHIGKKVYFRVVSFDKDRPNEVCSSSNIIPLEVTVSAPKVKEYRLEQPRCPEDNGGVQMFFDRELYPDEKISISVVKGKMFGREFMMELPVRSFDNDWFRANYKDKKITISNLPPLTNPSDMYQVQIRGEYHYGNDVITMYSDGKEFNKTFRIEPIPKLTALATKFNNLCYGEELGAIFVYISGGTPPYRYTKDGTTTDVVGDTFGLRDLAEGIYSFTITDSNGCSVLDDMGHPKVFSEIYKIKNSIAFCNFEKLYHPLLYG